jgi:membrane protease YdiL (CAAX protease family)
MIGVAATMGTPPPFADLWIAVTWGPLIEEVLFRGYLFSLLTSPVAYLATLALRHQGRGTVIAVPLESPSGS